MDEGADAYNVNLGQVRAGDWTSSSPALAVLGVRVGYPRAWTAEQAEAAFKDEIDKFIYSRYGNPTVAMFEERLRLLEGAEACFATASGMSAV